MVTKQKNLPQKGFFLGRGKREFFFHPFKGQKTSSITEAHPFCVHVHEKIIHWGSSSVSKGK
jgi:hypothetical protein